MRTWMHGWIEVKRVRGRKNRFKKKEWVGVRPLHDFSVNGDRDLMGCFFGIENDAHFKPLFGESRSIPNDISKEVDYFDCEEYYCNYVTHEEYKKIDWNEEAEDIADWIFGLEPDGTYMICGESRFAGESWSDVTMEEVERMQHGEVITKVNKDKYPRMPNGVKKVRMFKMKRNCVRRQSANYKHNIQQFEEFFDKLANIYGSKNVRLIVGWDWS